MQLFTVIINLNEHDPGIELLQWIIYSLCIKSGKILYHLSIS